MEQPIETGSITIQVYWNPPPIVLYDLGDRDDMDASLEDLREQVTSAVQQDATLGTLRPDQLSIETGWIGPHAQAIDTIDIVLRNLPPNLLQDIQDLIDNLRHGYVAPQMSGISQLFSLTGSYFGVDLNATVVFEHELWSPIQPSVFQELSSPILTFSAPYPSHLDAGSEKWTAWITASNHVGEDFREGVIEYLVKHVGEGIDGTQIEVHSVARPPMAGPLIGEFYIDLSYILGVLTTLVGTRVADRFVDRAVDAGLSRVKDRWPSELPADEDLLIAGNRVELLRRVKLHMSAEGYQEIPDDSFSIIPFNRRIQSGLPQPVDSHSPMGWVVEVIIPDGRWEFKVLNDPRKVERTTVDPDGRLIAKTTIDLLDIRGELYDPNIPQ